MKKKGKNDGVFHSFVEPIIPRFELKDILQVLIGASILAVPIGFTEETWVLGESLPLVNVFGLLGFVGIIYCYVHLLSIS
jgi:uncharacterized membrane protein